MRSVPTYQPTWRQNRARHASEARYPGLWKGSVVSSHTILGPTGTVLRDVSGHANNGTLTNMNAAEDWVLGEGGYALDFAGGGTRHVTIPSSVSFDSTRSSWGCWFKTTQAVSAQRPFLLGRHDPTSSRNGILIVLNVVTGVARSSVQDGSGAVASVLGSVALNDGVWHHILVTTNDEAPIIMYVDGFAVDTDTPSGPWGFGDQDIRIGDASDGFWESFRGLHGGPEVWNRVLVPSEARQIFQLGRGGWLAKRRRVFAKAPVAPPSGISVGRHYPRGVGRGIGRGVAA